MTWNIFLFAWSLFLVKAEQKFSETFLFPVCMLIVGCAQLEFVVDGYSVQT